MSPRTSSRTPVLVLLIGLLSGNAIAQQGQWGQFRGPNGSGVDTSTGYPVEFSAAKNVAWKVPVPYGQSSPVVVGGRMYLTARAGEMLITICLETLSGKELWRREVKRERVADVYKANDPASPTSAADENGVVAFFPDFGLVAYSAEGAPRWTCSASMIWARKSTPRRRSATAGSSYARAARCFASRNPGSEDPGLHKV